MQLDLSFDLKFEDLYDLQGIITIDQLFKEFLERSNPDLFAIYLKILADGSVFTEKQKSNILIDLAPILENFIAIVFKIEKEVGDLSSVHGKFASMAKIKREFIQRQAIKLYGNDDPDGDILKVQLEDLMNEKFTEIGFAENIKKWQENADEEKLDVAKKYAAFASLHNHNEYGTLFNHPKKIDFSNLTGANCDENEFYSKKAKARDGFGLTDKGRNLQYVVDQTNYCIFCHNQEKDSCSHGMKEKDGSIKKSELGVNLSGCPLEVKISEMNSVKNQGYSIGALAIIVIDNPMVAATGHRICNDCMKACIYQKQDPVDIPQIETRILQDTLSLPWGFEIYSLLTRWNPLNFKATKPANDSGYKVLVVGLGPSGFTLAHYLLNSGHSVVAIDGLKIEPLPKELDGPIYDVKTLYENLDERIMAGFGGVTEYGITVRWNKNFLKIIRLLLERRKNLSVIGGVRFGSNITEKSAFALGFDHIALCMGAGKPNILHIKNSLARGVRTASDFLMNLQLTGAAKKESIANLQIRMPIVVVGGGLTAIDTATESLAYYLVQIEKFMHRIEKIGVNSINLTEEELIIANEFISHAEELRAEKKKTNPDILGLINKWGGVKVLYRNGLKDAPSYRLNHEEVAKGLEEGIRFIQNVTPLAINVDQYGHAKEIVTKHSSSEMEIIFPAKTILIAAGTSPNISLSKEEPDLFKLDGKYFRAIDENGEKVSPTEFPKENKNYILTSINEERKAISFFGDLHPSFFGNVVKAMSSAKLGYNIINQILTKLDSKKDDNFIARIQDKLIARIHEVKRLSANIIEVTVRSPLAAENFQPGQFYRLQNYETFAQKINGTVLAMEGIAVTGAFHDKQNGLVSTIILEMGGSSSLCKFLKKDEPVVLMGPTGTATEIESGETVVLIGGGLGNAVLFSIGQAFRAKGSRVIYFAGYKKSSDICKIEEIEKAADEIIWCCDEGEVKPNQNDERKDRSFHGNIVEAIENYATSPTTPLINVDRIICIGSDMMMNAVSIALSNQLKKYFKPGVVSIASINSPMQCMMKEICAQCLQRHVNKETGLEYYVYSCVNQDQNMQDVDFNFLHQRLKQNSLQEKLTAKWIASLA